MGLETPSGIEDRACIRRQRDIVYVIAGIVCDSAGLTLCDIHHIDIEFSTVIRGGKTIQLPSCDMLA